MSGRPFPRAPRVSERMVTAVAIFIDADGTVRFDVAAPMEMAHAGCEALLMNAAGFIVDALREPGRLEPVVPAHAGRLS